MEQEPLAAPYADQETTWWVGLVGWLSRDVISREHPLLAVKMHEMRCQIPDSCLREGTCSRPWQGKPKLFGDEGGMEQAGGRVREPEGAVEEGGGPASRIQVNEEESS